MSTTQCCYIRSFCLLHTPNICFPRLLQQIICPPLCLYQLFLAYSQKQFPFLILMFLQEVALRDSCMLYTNVTEFDTLWGGLFVFQMESTLMHASGKDVAMRNCSGETRCLTLLPGCCSPNPFQQHFPL